MQSRMTLKGIHNNIFILNKKKTSVHNNTKNILGGIVFLNFCELEILMNKLDRTKECHFYEKKCELHCSGG